MSRLAQTLSSIPSLPSFPLLLEDFLSNVRKTLYLKIVSTSKSHEYYEHWHEYENPCSKGYSKNIALVDNVA